jgi:hypothetical protein
MRKMIAAMVAAFAMTVALPAFAGDGMHWIIRPAASWTVNDQVLVTWYFTENSSQLGSQTTTAFDTTATVAVDQTVDGSQFLGSGRTICLNAFAVRKAEPTVLATATPNCFRFPFNTLEAPTLLSP